MYNIFTEHLLISSVRARCSFWFQFHHQDLSFCDDHFKPDSWEVYSLSDIHKYRHVISMMEVEENLPLPLMSEESQLVTSGQLRKV